MDWIAPLYAMLETKYAEQRNSYKKFIRVKLEEEKNKQVICSTILSTYLHTNDVQYID